MRRNPSPVLFSAPLDTVLLTNCWTLTQGNALRCAIFAYTNDESLRPTFDNIFDFLSLNQRSLEIFVCSRATRPGDPDPGHVIKLPSLKILRLCDASTRVTHLLTRLSHAATDVDLCVYMPNNDDMVIPEIEGVRRNVGQCALP